jgi:cell division protein FtsB
MEIKSKAKQTANNLLNQFNDIKFTGQVAFVVIVLLVSWSGVKVIQSNYGLQKQITAIEQQNDIQRLQNENQELQNQYYNTKQYLDLAAREDFGLADPGEKEILVPKSVALSNTENIPVNAAQTSDAISIPAQQTNLSSWVDFFFHKNTK